MIAGDRIEQEKESEKGMRKGCETTNFFQV